MPFRSTLEGQVALIGDNLGSHFSNNVIKATLVHVVKFITLPASSTHVCQPLGVAVFKGMKGKWKKVSIYFVPKHITCFYLSISLAANIFILDR